MGLGSRLCHFLDVSCVNLCVMLPIYKVATWQNLPHGVDYWDK